jgi:hypothetical protein
MIDPLYDTYLQTLPDVHPAGQSSDASSYSLPFSIKNHSEYFTVDETLFHCEYSIVTWDMQSPKPHNTPYKLFRARGTMTTGSKQADIQIPPGQSVNFACDASEAATASIEGDKLPITEIRMRINIGYHTKLTFVSVPRQTYISPMFIWKKGTSGFQWYEGDIIQ